MKSEHKIREKISEIEFMLKRATPRYAIKLKLIADTLKWVLSEEAVEMVEI